MKISISISISISSLRFVVAYQGGVVEFFHLKAKRHEHEVSRHGVVSSLSTSLPLMSQHATCDIFVSRTVNLFSQDIQFMEMSVDKIYVVSVSSQVKVRELR